MCRAFLEIGKNRWELSIIIPIDSDEDEDGQEPETEDFPDILEVTLQDHLVIKDLRGNDVITLPCGQLVV